MGSAIETITCFLERRDVVGSTCTEGSLGTGILLFPEDNVGHAGGMVCLGGCGLGHGVVGS